MVSKKAELVVVAIAKAKAGKEGQLEKALRDVIAPTRAQKGCIDFQLFRSTQDGASIAAFERWASKEDHDRHLQGEHVKKLMASFETVIAEPPTFFLMNPL